MYVAPTVDEIEHFRPYFERVWAQLGPRYPRELRDALLPYFLVADAVGFDEESLSGLPTLMQEVLDRLEDQAYNIRLAAADLPTGNIPCLQIVYNWATKGNDPGVMSAFDGEQAYQESESLYEALDHTRNILEDREGDLIDVPGLLD